MTATGVPHAAARVLGLLVSRRVAVTVLSVMAGLLAVATMIPSRAAMTAERAAELAARRPMAWWMVEHLHAQALVQGPVFIGMGVFLFAALVASIVLRVRAFVTQYRRGARPEVQRFRTERDVQLAGPLDDAVARVEAVLAPYYRLARTSAGVVVGARGTPGFAGSIAFHAGLVVVLLGILVSSRTFTSGEIMLPEGFPAPFAAEAFSGLRGGENLPLMPGVTIGVREFAAEYSALETPVDYSALFSVRVNGNVASEAVTRVNEPFAWNGFQFTLHRFGFAPDLRVVDADGRVLAEGVAVLKLVPAGATDEVPLPGGARLVVTLWPDFAARDGRAGTRSPQPRRPVLELRWLGPDGLEVAAGRVARGARWEQGGRVVEFRGLDYWAGFIMARDRGLWPLLLGSLLGALGLLLRLVYPDQAVRVECADEGTGVRARFVASTRFFPALHEQWVDGLVDRVAGGKKAGA